MKIDSPGLELLPFLSDRTAIGVAVWEDDRAARGGGEDFAGGAGFSTGGDVFFAERVVDGALEGVLAAGRFLFSGMPLEIIPSVGGCDQRLIDVIHCRTARADGYVEDPKIRRSEGRRMGAEFCLVMPTGGTALCAVEGAISPRPRAIFGSPSNAVGSCGSTLEMLTIEHLRGQDQYFHMALAPLPR